MQGDVAELQERLRAFAVARDWDQFHDPKNLVIALTVEVGELLEPFQWLTPDEAWSVTQDEEVSAALRDELADVAIYLLRLSDVLGVDLARAVHEKIDRNERRYPAERVRGRADLGPLREK